MDEFLNYFERAFIAAMRGFMGIMVFGASAGVAISIASWIIVTPYIVLILSVMTMTSLIVLYRIRDTEMVDNPKPQISEAQISQMTRPFEPKLYEPKNEKSIWNEAGAAVSVPYYRKEIETKTMPSPSPLYKEFESRLAASLSRLAGIQKEFSDLAIDIDSHVEVMKDLKGKIPLNLGPFVLPDEVESFRKRE